MIVTNLKYNQMTQELKQLRAKSKVMREVLEQIASVKRGSLSKRLASSCLDFIKHCTPSQQPSEGKGGGQ